MKKLILLVFAILNWQLTFAILCPSCIFDSPDCLGVYSGSSLAIGSSSLTTGSMTGSQFIVITGIFYVDNVFSLVNANVKLDCNATIRIRGGGSLTIDHSWLHSCDNVNMWNGISDQGGAVQLNIINNSAIEDAKIAVDIRSVQYNIDNNYFNKNYTNIKLTQYTGVGSILYRNQFTCYSNYGVPSSLSNALLLPYSGRTGYGLLLDECSNVIVGDVSKGNLFENLIYDIFSSYSDIYIIDNNFSKSSFGVFNVNTIYAPINTFSLVVLNNNFTDITSTGVWSSNHAAIEAKQNYFERCNEGFNVGTTLTTVGWPTPAIPIKIEENTLNNTIDAAIKFQYCVGASLIEVANNKINDCSPNCSLAFTKFGIKYQPLGTANNLSNNILFHHNTIKNCRWGIALQNTNPSSTIKKNIRIYENDIVVDLPSSTVISTGSFYGIRLENTGAAIVNNNRISRSGSNQVAEANSICAIYSNFVRRYKVDNNTSTNLGTGFRIRGINLNSKYNCNSFIDNYYGFDAGITTIAASMSDQGRSIAGSDNEWSLPGISSNRVNGNANPLNWYFRGSGINSNPKFPDGPLTGAIKWGNCNGIYTCPVYPAILNDEEISREQDLLPLLFDDEVFLDHEVENIWYRKLMIMELLNEYPEWMENNNDEYDPKLQEIYNQNTNGFIGKYLAIIGYFDVGDYDAAMALVSNLSGSNQIEQNLKEYLSLWITVFAYGNSELNEQQRQQVFLIACQNSFEGGPSVFLARALLDLDDMDDSGNCSLRNFGNNQESQSLIIFPNPTNGIATIQIPQYKEVEQYLISVYALDGRLLYSKNIASNTTQYNLDLSKFTDGFYNVVLSNLNGQIVSKSKLIVSK